MKNRSSLNNLFNRDRKTLYIILSIVMVSVLTLTVVYAALSTTLNINGNAEVSAANWEIYLDNIQLNSNSVTTNIPTITNKTTASFTTTLSKPGDYYMFTIDVVNNGSIDAMIDFVTKTPELSVEQKKYLNYIVEYQNGQSITTKQLVTKKSFVRLKVKVEFRKDITASDLPQTSESLNLSFKVNYVQSDDSSENITIDNNGKLLKVVSGDYDTVGSEICIGEECFYVISSDEDSVTMLAKYNLYVGKECANGNPATCIPYGDEATGLQDSTMIGYCSTAHKGVIAFSSSAYWADTVSTYSAYVYDSNSTLYNYVENYKIYLKSQGANIKEARLINKEEIESLGCDRNNFSCTQAPEWLYATSYWTGIAGTKDSIYNIYSNGILDPDIYNIEVGFGIRPVIVLAL